MPKYLLLWEVDPAKVPADRFQTAEAFADALRQPDAEAEPRPARATLRMAVAAAAVVVVADAATIGVLSRGDETTTAVSSPTLAVLPFEN